MTAEYPRRRRKSPMMLAGWLFADLFLVLMLTALGAEGKAQSTPPPHVTPSPDVSRKSCPASYQLEPLTLHLTGLDFAGLRRRSEPAIAPLLAQTRQQLAANGAQGRYAGLILAFGISAYDYLPDAEATAQAAGDILTSRLVRFHGAKVRRFKIEIGRTGNTAVDHGNQLTMDVYFFIRC